MSGVPLGRSWLAQGRVISLRLRGDMRESKCADIREVSLRNGRVDRLIGIVMGVEITPRGCRQVCKGARIGEVPLSNS